MVSSLGQLAGVSDGNWLRGLATLATKRLNLFNYVHAINNSAEDDVLVVKPRSLNGADEELRPVGVRASISHRECTRGQMLKSEVLVGKLLTVDRLATSAIVIGKIASLTHEVRDDSMETAALEAESLLAGAQRTEVLGRLGNYIRAQLEHDPSNGSSIHCHIEENLRQTHLCERSSAIDGASGRRYQAYS